VSTVTNQNTTVTTKAITPQEWPQWDAYVNEHKTDSLFFRTGWDRVFRTYGLKIDRFAAFRDGKVIGALPLVFQQSFLFGKHLVSLPWFDCCGVLADDDQARDELLSAAIGQGQRRRVEEVQLRQVEPLELSPHVRTDKVLMQLQLPETGEELWSDFTAKVRNQIRKGQKEGLTVESGGGEFLDDFYDVYSENMRDLGSPAHSRNFFRAILDAFPEETKLHVAKLETESVGGGLTMTNGEAWEIPWASSLRKYNKKCVNHVMYAHMLEQAVEHGATAFRFGRSTPDSGTYKFKKQWGAEPVQLYWYLLAADENKTPDTTPPKDSYGKAVEIWQKIPVWLTRMIGPRIISKVA